MLYFTVDDLDSVKFWQCKQVPKDAWLLLSAFISYTIVIGQFFSLEIGHES